jgi:hypothetical protein
MKLNGYKIAHEHIYWDQASLLAQVGLLDTKNLPITGVKQAKKFWNYQSKPITVKVKIFHVFILIKK